jgi:hypothetical protein
MHININFIIITKILFICIPIHYCTYIMILTTCFLSFWSIAILVETTSNVASLEEDLSIKQMIKTYI